jgi:aminopeptidase YwaD
MFNLDMVGRLTPDRDTGRGKLLVEGNGTSKAFEALVDRLSKKHDDFLMKRSASLLPNSDHFSFYQKKVPVLFFWTGLHPDYHRPSDTADKINVRGMRRVVDLAEEVVGELAAMPQRPGFEKVKVGGGVSPSRGPRLGIIPDYGEGGKGLEVGGVSDGGPAARAGLKKGDVITAINDRPVKNIETYMEAMSAQKRGSTITVAILRDGKKQEVKVKLD